MALNKLKCRVAVFYLDDWLMDKYGQVSYTCNDDYIDFIKPALKIIEASCESSKLMGHGSPIHSPDDECKKNHIHLMFYGSISTQHWLEFTERLQVKIPQISFFPKFLDRNEIQGYANYLTHETEKSKDKQQFTDEEKEVFDCATQL